MLDWQGWGLGPVIRLWRIMKVRIMLRKGPLSPGEGKERQGVVLSFNGSRQKGPRKGRRHSEEREVVTGSR